MDERVLLLLGILMHESLHGYQINEFIERNLSRVTDMKKATAYSLLERLAKNEMITVRTEQEGNRPPRKVYTITKRGVEEFHRLLQESLSTAESYQFRGDIGLMFLDHLPREQVAELLQQRLEQVKQRLEILERAPKHGFGQGVDLAMEHHAFMLRSEHEWLHSIVQRFQK
ncbi:PadR family transcriptional regulator [Tumebacillus flagellatus]|uniref:PadR family transcriptional regulator n=1 Tax=Tumebacillus flagellatus TaxID=1157490 RepID=A0A074LL08_9BACL|nr:PadR family transcriptional regulator [Tumebacillus flagellatus]KEO81235.1 PadR family transcriptional regulator [Tumebacillus flagellatus]